MAIVVIAVIAGAATILLNTSTATSTISTSISSSACETTPASSAQPARAIIPLLNAYSAVTWALQGTVNGTAYNFTASYTVVSVNSTVYQVNILELTPSQSIATTVWFLNNGIVAALDIAGNNFSGTLAGYYFQTYFSLWENAIEYGQLIATFTSPSSFFHSTGTSPVTLGPSEFAVTNYTSNSLPETISGCNGASVTLTSGGVFSVGAPSGSDYQLITYLTAAGYGTITGTSGEQQTTTFNIVSQITSVTVAGKEG
jgi:hypothetical protein